MGMISYIKEELNVIKERDPAIKTGMEVLLYSSFKAILSYRVAHKLFLNNIIFWQDGFHSVLQERPELRSIRGNNRERTLY